MGQETEGLLLTIIEEQKRTLAALEQMQASEDSAGDLEAIRDSQRDISDLVEKIVSMDETELIE